MMQDQIKRGNDVNLRVGKFVKRFLSLFLTPEIDFRIPANRLHYSKKLWQHCFFPSCKITFASWHRRKEYLHRNGKAE